MKRPAFQFYPADWRKDPALSACSLAARGLWIELMCIAHEGGTYGVLSINGKPMAPAQIARMVGESPAAVVKLLAELEDAGVFSRDEQGCIYSRRMVKDEHVRNVRADAGRLGGNPNLLKQKVKQNGEQNLTPSSSSSSSSSSSNIEEPNGSVGSADRLPRCETQSVVDLYHDTLPELPRVRLMTDGRRKAISAFWRFVMTSKKSDGTPRATSAAEAMEWIGGYFTRARDNDFLMGRGSKAPGHEGWQCDFDFLLTDKGKRHVIEKTREAA